MTISISHSSLQTLLKQLPAPSGKTVAAQNAAFAAQAADHLARTAAVDSMVGTQRGAPILTRPGRDVPDRQEVDLLTAELDSMQDPAQLQLGSAINAAVARLYAAEGATPPRDAETEALGKLLDSDPELHEAMDQVRDLAEDKTVARFDMDQRFDYLLKLISFFMEMALKQRLQGASMIEFAERSVNAMGERMISSAHERRTGAIIGLVVGTAVASAGVAMGGFAAYKNVSSIKHNEVRANQLNSKADKLMLKHAEGATTAPAGQRASIEQNSVLRATHQRNQAAELHAVHARNTTHNSVVTQGGHAIGQAANSSSSIATAEGEVKAAQQTKEAEIHRQNSDTERKISETSSQQAGKDDESNRASLELMKAVLQRSVDTADAINRNLA